MNQPVYPLLVGDEKPPTPPLGRVLDHRAKAEPLLYFMEDFWVPFIDGKIEASPRVIYCKTSIPFGKADKSLEKLLFLLREVLFHTPGKIVSPGKEEGASCSAYSL